MLDFVKKSSDVTIKKGHYKTIKFIVADYYSKSVTINSFFNAKKHFKIFEYHY